MIRATKEGFTYMITRNKLIVVGGSIVACMVACAGCGTAESKSGDPVSKNHLSFMWVEKGDREVQFNTQLDSCRDDRVGCYGVVDLDLDSADQSGRSTEGDLTKQQLEALEALLSSDQLDHYEEDQDPSCDGDIKYTLLYDDAEGKYHFYCLVSGDHLSPETENAIEVLTDLAEKLLVEGTPVKDKN